jgi:hypothetical protein
MATKKRRVNIVGSSYYPGAGDWLAKIAPGQQLRVEREPNNEHDANAIAVYIFQQKLGHFPAVFAAEVAPIMDAGYALRAAKSLNFPGTGAMVVEWELPDVPSADAGTDQ